MSLLREWKLQQFTSYHKARRWLLRHQASLEQKLVAFSIPNASRVSRVIVACLLSSVDSSMRDPAMVYDNLLVTTVDRLVGQVTVGATDLVELVKLFDAWRSQSATSVLKFLKNEVVLAKIQSTTSDDNAGVKRYEQLRAQIRSIGGEDHVRDAEALWSRNWA